MSKEQQKADDGKIDKQYAFGLLYLMLNAHRMLIIVFIRHSFGIRAYEPHGLVAFIFMLIFAGSRRVFLIYFWLWIVAVACQRIYSLRLRMKGVHYHSRFQGVPWLAMRVPSVKNEAEARRVEPIICLLVGLLVMTISEPLGYFITAGFVSLTGCMAIDAIIERQILLSMTDGELEMRYYSERYRAGK